MIWFALLAVFAIGLAVLLDAEYQTDRDDDHKGPTP